MEDIIYLVMAVGVLYLIYLIIKYIILPLIGIVGAIGMLIGGTAAIGNYYRSFRDNVKTVKPQPGETIDITPGSEPAIKSYFFGKGYSDLYRTISGSWQSNLASAKDYWSKREGFFKSVAMIFAAFAVVLFGSIVFLSLSVIHITVLFAFFLIIYMSFTLIWFIDWIYRKYNKIFTACPYCSNHSELPVYICPKCRAEHNLLIPGVYGIWKRTCVCGEKLPTAIFNGRSKLEAKCPNPNCGHEIKTGEATPICIPIIGGPSVGKTCFLFASVQNLIEEIAKKNKWDISFMEAKDENMYQLVSSNFQQGIVPAKTAKLMPTAFNFFISSKRWNPAKVVYLFDPAGEAYMDTENLLEHLYIEYMHGIIFLIDPFSIPELCAVYDEEFEKGKNQFMPSEMMLDDTFDRMIINMEKNFGYNIKQKISKPCAVVINKVDVFDLEDRLGESAITDYINHNPNKTRQEAINAVCHAFLRELGLSGLLRKLDEKFSTVQFFTCSSLGKTSESGGFNPYRVAEPVTWLLGKADRDLKVSSF